MTIWNQNDSPPEEPSDETTWEQGDTQELSMREVSFRRREPQVDASEVDAPPSEPIVVPTEPPAADAPPVAAPVELDQEKVPFYKREITFGRKKPQSSKHTVAVPVLVAETSTQPAAVVTEPSAASPVETDVSASTPGPATSVRTRRSGGGPSGPNVGIKIGQGAISVAVVEQRGGTGDLTRLVRRPLDPGVVVDGEVKDVTALAQALESLWADEGLPRRGVKLGLFGSRIGVRPVDIVGIEEADQFANAVRFKAHEVLPIGVHESVLDFRVLSEQVNESGERVRRTLLVVAPRDQVVAYVEAFRTARIGLEAIDIDALALLRTFVEPGLPGISTAQDSAAVVVAMDREGSTLLVSGGGMCEFTRAFDWGGNLLAAGIGEELELSPDQAWGLLEGLARHGAGAQPLEDDQERAAAEIVRARLVPFARELVSSLQFYQQQLGSLGIADIVLTGTLADVPGVPDALHQLIGVAVRVGDPTSRLVVRGALGEENWTPNSMAVPIGLAVVDRPERTVDLIPPDQRVKIRWRPRLAPVLLPAAAAIPLVVVGLAFFQTSGTVTDREARLGAAEAELAALPKPNASIDPALTGKAGQRASTVASLLGQRLAWNGMLNDLSRVLPADVWLTTVSASLPDPAVTAATSPAGVAGPTAVEITGKAVNYASLSQALTRLSTMPSLTDVKLFNSTAEEIGLPSGKKVKVVGFQISANVDSAGGS